MLTRWLPLILAVILLISFSGQAYTVASDDNTVVSFTDSNLESAVRSALKLHADELITQGKMKTLTVLKANSMGITSLEGLQFAHNLDTLEVYYNKISDLDPIKELSKLTNLYLKGNEITDISPLSNLSSLKKLWLRQNKIIDISALASLSNLYHLDLADTNSSNLSPLGGLTNLQYLCLDNNKNIDSLEPLSGLSNLKELSVYKTGVSDLTPVGQLVNLHTFYAGYNNITQVHPLKSLTKLKVLKLNDNKLTNINPLINVENLNKVYLAGNPLDLSAGSQPSTVIIALEEKGVWVDISAGVSDGQGVTGVSLNYTKLTLEVGAYKNLSATVLPKTAAQKGVTWNSDKTSVATVNSNGKVIAVGPGTAKITVKTKDGGKIAHCVVTVTTKSSGEPKDPTVVVTGVSLSHNELNMEPGEFFSLEAAIVPSDASNKTLVWSSDKPAVAKVDSSGKVSALSPGVAIIKLTSKDGGYTAECTVTVSAPAPTDLAFKYTNFTIYVGNNKKLPVIMAPKNAWAELVWVSSNPGVATVDQQGHISALAAGETVISVSTGALSASCTLTIVDPQHKTGVKYNLGDEKNSLNIPKEILKEHRELDFSHGKMQIIVPTIAWLDALYQLGLDESASVIVEVEQFTPDIPNDLIAVGLAYSFNLYAEEVRVSTFADKLMLTMGYDPAKVSNPEKLAIYWFNTGTDNWDKLPSLVDTNSNTVTVLLSHWSSFALLEPVTSPARSGWLYVIITALGLNAMLILAWLYKRR